LVISVLGGVLFSAPKEYPQ